jgi:hypothetical protein
MDILAAIGAGSATHPLSSATNPLLSRARVAPAPVERARCPRPRESPRVC